VLRYSRAEYPVRERARGGATDLRFTIRESEWITFDDHAHDFQLFHRFEYRLRLEDERVRGQVRALETSLEDERSCTLPIAGRFAPAE